MRSFYLATALLLVGCGSEGGGSDQEPTKIAEAAKDQPRVAGSDMPSEALLVQDAASVPACDDAREGQLVYVKDDAVFWSCGDGSWLPIDLRGDKGDAGVQGEKGEKGEKGERGEDGVAAAVNTWLDPISGETWLIGGTAATPAGCGSDWRLPTFAEVTAASNDGMYAAFVDRMANNAYDCALHTDGGLNVNNVKPGVNCASRSAPFGIYCVKDTAG